MEEASIPSLATMEEDRAAPAPPSHAYLIDEHDEPWVKRVKSLRKPGLYPSLLGPLEVEADDHSGNNNKHATKLAQDVAKDVPRSFGGRASTDDEQAALSEVLTAYGRYEAGEGYTQGMGFIVYFALQRQGSLSPLAKENAFWLLVDASRRVPEGFFSRAAHDEILVFEEVVKEFAPAIKQHLGDNLRSALCYLIPRWFLSLFVFAMTETMTLRLWNEVLFPYPRDTSSHRFDLVISLHKIAFALLETHSSRLLSEVRVVENALDRVSKRYAGSMIEAELLSHRDARLGMEFMQNVVDATLKDTNETRLIGLVKDSPFNTPTFMRIRVDVLHHQLSMQRTVNLVIRIQRWYRGIFRRKVRSEAPHPASVGEFFTSLACAGGGRRDSAGSGCSLQ